MKKIIKIHEKDNVAVALEPLQSGEKTIIEKKQILISNQIPQGHKVALRDLSPGQDIIKYGESIGIASKPIETGEWVHSHNIETNLKEERTYTYQPTQTIDKGQTSGTFWGYPRSNGEAGTRNELWIIPTVGCVNGIGRKLAQLGNELASGEIDGVYCFEHPYGCSQMGDDLEHTKAILLSLCRHANAGGVLLLGLGCENINLNVLKVKGKRIRTLNCQEEEDEVRAGTVQMKELISQMAACKRTEQPLSKLKIGVKCGGSDGFSGITANPLVGSVTEALVSAGASVLMTEVPEMFGAEAILMNRCKNRKIFEKLVKLIKDFKSYYTSCQLPIYENPSPGNKAGGITTLEEKSLGCIQKCGKATVEDVWEYGQSINKSGLNLISAPGNDLVSTTALVAAGAQMILFTTGRGTPLGAVVPTIKIASNTDLNRRKSGWIDFNAGELLEGTEKEEMKDNLLQLICQAASGKQRTCNEANGIREFAIFKTGVTL